MSGLVAKVKCSAFSNQRLDTLGDVYKPSHSAIVSVEERITVGQIETKLAKAEADVFTAEIRADIAE